MTTIMRETGCEGPKHDPYGFEELAVTRRTPTGEHTIRMHLGLVDWIEVDGERYHGDNVLEAFEAAVGCKYEHALRAYQRLEDTCEKCGRVGAIVDSVSGYPGETLYICKCGAVVSGSMDWSAII